MFFPSFNRGDSVDPTEMLRECFAYGAAFLVSLSWIQSDLMKAAKVGIGAKSSMRGMPVPLRTLVQNLWYFNHEAVFLVPHPLRLCAFQRDAR